MSEYKKEKRDDGELNVMVEDPVEKAFAKDK